LKIILFLYTFSIFRLLFYASIFDDSVYIEYVSFYALINTISCFTQLSIYDCIARECKLGNTPTINYKIIITALCFFLVAVYLFIYFKYAEINVKYILYALLLYLYQGALKLIRGNKTAIASLTVNGIKICLELAIIATLLVFDIKYSIYIYELISINIVIIILLFNEIKLKNNMLIPHNYILANSNVARELKNYMAFTLYNSISILLNNIYRLHYEFVEIYLTKKEIKYFDIFQAIVNGLNACVYQKVYGNIMHRYHLIVKQSIYSIFLIFIPIVFYLVQRYIKYYDNTMNFSFYFIYFCISFAIFSIPLYKNQIEFLKFCSAFTFILGVTSALLLINFNIMHQYNIITMGLFILFFYIATTYFIYSISSKHNA
jgi:hypothetical protein